MGTAIVVEVRDRAADERAATGIEVAIEAAFDHLRHVDGRFSTYRSDSEVSRFNRGEIDARLCSAELREVLAMCETARSTSDGYFDIRGHRSDGAIDPSGLVKGWAVEGASRILDAAGASNYTINAAGDLVCRLLLEKKKNTSKQDVRD